MRVRNVFSTLVLVMSITAIGCKDSPTEPSKATPVERPKHGWQMVIQSTYGEKYNVTPIAGVKTDDFTPLTLGDFYLAAPMVFDLKNSDDTVYVGYATYTYFFSENFVKDTMTLNVSGNMALSKADSAKVKIGKVNSIYRLTFWDIDQQELVSSRSGNHVTSILGNDFQFSEKIQVGGYSYADVIVVFYRPVVCADFAARSVSSKGFSFLQTDGVLQYKSTTAIPDMTITCNPAIMPGTDLRASGSEDTKPVKLLDYLRNHRQSN